VGAIPVKLPAEGAVKNRSLILSVALLFGFFPLKIHAEDVSAATRFLTDPHAMRAMAGRFDTHAQTVEDEARKFSALGQELGTAGDPHSAARLAQVHALETEHQAIVRDVLAAGDFWGGAGSVACQEYITQLGRNFQVIYEGFNQQAEANLPPNLRVYSNLPQAFRNIVNMLHSVRDGLIRDANNYEQHLPKPGTINYEFGPIDSLSVQ
jgi:hypothetical protein